MRALVAVLLVTACGADPAPAPDRRVLRLSTHYGLEPMSAAESDSATAYLKDLVYAPALDHLSVESRQGAVVRLVRKPASGMSAERLATINGPGVANVANMPQGVEVTFVNEEAAESALAAPGFTNLFLDAGPYEPGSFATDRMVLRRRAGGRGPAEIVVRNVAAEEEQWRLLLAREIDLVTHASSDHLRWLVDVPTVRVVPVARPTTVALHFRIAGALTDPRLRHAISLALRRPALAKAVFRNAGAAIDRKEDATLARTLLAHTASRRPAALRMLTLASLPDARKASVAIVEQLAAAGLRVEIIAASDGEFDRRLPAGDWDLLLWNGSLQPDSFFRFVGGSPANRSGYASPEFDAAFARGDLESAGRILERDLPLTPLYSLREAVVADRRLCGIKPVYSYDSSWLADVHPCAPGETE